MDKADILQDISVELSKSIKKHLQHIKQLPTKDKKEIEKLISTFKDGLDDLSEDVNESSVNEAKIAFINDKLIGDRIQKSGLLPLLGTNSKPFSGEKMKFTRELSNTLKKLYKKYSSLDVK